MKKISILASVAALTLAAATPVAADSEIQGDPYVSTQGGGLGLGLGGGAGLGVGLAVLGGVVAITVIASSNGT